MNACIDRTSLNFWVYAVDETATAIAPKVHDFVDLPVCNPIEARKQIRVNILAHS